MSFQPEGMQPDGYQPEGYQPEADVGQLPTGFAFDINGATIPVIDPDDTRVFSPSWADELPAGVTLEDVAHTLPSPLVHEGESNTDTTSSVRISGAKHSQMYSVQCTATLSNGETMSRGFPLRCFNG